MDQDFESIITKTVEETLESPFFASLSRPQYEIKKQEIIQFFHELIVFVMFNNLNESQMSELQQMDFASSEAKNKFAKWAAEIPNFLYLYEADLKKYSQSIHITGQIPTLE